MATNVRVEARKLWSNATQADADANFRQLLHEFKRQVRFAGVMKELSDRQYYESEPKRRKRKRKERQAKERSSSGYLTR